MGYKGCAWKGQIMDHNPEHPDHKANLVALRRIEGQVRGVQGMVQKRAYCIDIINQIAAIRGALDRVEEKILEKHFSHCVQGAMEQGSKRDKQEKLHEILQLIHQIRRR